jgi:hypothetical protein
MQNIADSAAIVDTLLGMHPRDNTNISLATAKAHWLALSTPPEFEVAELFFTDGEANRGLLTAEALKQQKQTSYAEIQAARHQPRPFLWCAALGRGASRKVVEGLSEASGERGLWIHVQADDMKTFAGDMAEAVSSVLSSVPVTVNLASETPRTVWIRSDLMTPVYLDQKPHAVSFPVHARAQEQKYRLTTQYSDQMVTLYRLREKLSQVQSNTIELSEAQDWQKQLVALQKIQDALILGNGDLYMHFENTRLNLLAVVEDLLSRAMTTPYALTLERQFSCHRMQSLQSDTVQATKQRFRAAVDGLDGLDASWCEIEPEILQPPPLTKSFAEVVQQEVNKAPGAKSPSPSSPSPPPG